MSACLLQEVFPPFFLGTQDIVSEFQRGSERGSELASSASLFCAVINARACCTITWSHYSFAIFFKQQLRANIFPLRFPRDIISKET